MDNMDAPTMFLNRLRIELGRPAVCFPVRVSTDARRFGAAGGKLTTFDDRHELSDSRVVSKTNNTGGSSGLSGDVDIC
jgi:hypothetical protein